MCVCYLRGFPSESVYKTNRKRANPRFRIAAIYPSVNIQPLMKTPKIDIQQGTHINYDEKYMRDHLIYCLERGFFSQFPKNRIGRVPKF